MRGQDGNMTGYYDVEQPQQAHYYASTTATPPAHIAQTAPVYVVAGGTVKEPLPCCGIGIGWALFIVGFILGAIPWYIGAIMLCCGVHKKEPREKAGLISCLVAGIVITIIIIIRVVTLM